ncbi:class I SAM-dependent methyltransferase [Carboxylicivirga linearis]|uniref:Class I SAM-dependent methyltransferase n=1 Tax=Carboxylicivirga linearis TaxID=1628157 RepID=A0ABS5JXT8_9BACT|nr:class I SAM-dependent methyltransferase [Carboxylicivirga linearis]MBS2099279.1 class I SAM-dependent methyltransferase [Carboxylicivirga linearis]
MNYIEINKNLWNKKTEIHYESDFYDVESFKKGKNSLNPIELQLLGDVEGKKILHLQCHFGQDTISFARLGAKATGVDLSDKAIEKAQQLNDEVGADATFIQSDIYQLPEVLDEQFDIVFTSYGTIGWLPDMDRWAQLINRFLKPGGQFLIVEFHPVIWMFSYDFTKVEFNYLKSEPIVEELEGTYTNNNADIKEQSVSWNHGLGEVMNALIKTGLSIADVQEYDYSPYDCFQNTVETDKGKYQIKGLEGKLPMLYSILASK